MQALTVIRRIPVYATLLLAAFLIASWSLDTEWITETLEAVEAGHVASTAATDLPLT